ncbi:hypothetical protein [Lignipirellula cremea]|uniref:Uncharacterized protein n=1 Tax=Lignipirellula cremea TaxID=2528010 RepID=A0A518DLP1_9BACT|nr:hypothetical protein [Lignipirellula cremea]QDU92752.1 hypothetical protein Pla8534_05010 [Lignipirellula cremea]
MDKFPISFNDTGAKGFIAHHIEKIALGLAVLLTAVLFATGFTSETIKPNETPDRLKSTAEQALTRINDPTTWEVRLKPTMMLELNHADRVEISRASTPMKSYPAEVALNNSEVSPGFVKRSDPKLFPPSKPELIAFHGSLARKAPDTYVDPILKGKAAVVAAAPVAGAEALLGGGGEAVEGGRQLTERQKRRLLERDPEEPITGKSAIIGINGVAVKALAPWGEQEKAFLGAFADAEGYASTRDQPDYIDFELQRADVTALGAEEPIPAGAWKTVNNRAKSDLYAAQLYAAAVAERVDPRYVDETLTQQVPPILLRNLTDLFAHSETPFQSKSVDKESVTDDAAPIDPFAFPGLTPKKAQPGEDAPSAADPEATSVAGGPVKPADQVLVRVFDLSGLEPEHKYCYRVRLILADPNYLAMQGDTKITRRMLTEEVVNRLEALEKSGVASSTLVTAWGEASDPILIPSRPEKLLAGDATWYSTRAVPISPDVSVEFPIQEPEASVVVSVWDKSLTVDVSAEREVMRGSFLNFQSFADVVHPALLSIVRIDNYNFDLDAIVLDMRGGERLPHSSGDKPLTAPAEIFFFDSDGNLIVRNEVDDEVEFRDLMLIDDEVAAD